MAWSRMNLQVRSIMDALVHGIANIEQLLEKRIRVEVPPYTVSVAYVQAAPAVRQICVHSLVPRAVCRENGATLGEIHSDRWRGSVRDGAYLSTGAPWRSSQD